jgi:hypothetical protein
VLDGVEVLLDEPMSSRGRRMLDAMIAAAPGPVVTTKAYAGRHQILMMYGAGQERRRLALQLHRARGGRVVTWDLGYWDRGRAMRLAIDQMHPSAEQLALAPAGVWRSTVNLRSDADPAGPVLLVGLGHKSATLYGLRHLQWERAALARIKAEFPGRQVLWRPKGRAAIPMGGTVLRHGMEIEEALRGCGLVVCLHSNVAVDACLAGVPVQCEAGAALALYAAGRDPAPAERAEFLRRLGFWNWHPGEAGEAWEWIERVIG